jgi:hypothetical protein
MKYLIKFNENKDDKSIEYWCSKLKSPMGHCIINDDDTVDINGSGHLYYQKLEKIPIQFGIVSGDFIAHNNRLTSLKGCPSKVGGYFHVSINLLKDLEYSPKEVNGDYYDCSDNNLVSIKGVTNQLISFYCNSNNLTSLEELPIIKKGFNCLDNPVYEVYKLFKTSERFLASMDYKYLRGTNIIQRRFEKACIDAEIKVPDSIPGYKYIDL